MHFMRGLQAQILLWIILPLILVLTLVSLGSITLHQRSMRLMVAGRDVEQVRLASAHLNDELGKRAETLQTLVELAGTEGDPEPQPLESRLLLQQFDLGLGLRTEGDLVAPVPQALEEDAWQRALTAAAGEPGEVIVWPLIEVGSPAPVIMALVDPETGRGVAGAVSAAGLDLPGLLLEFSEGSRVAYIVDDTGEIVYHPRPESVGMPLTGHDAILEAARTETGFTYSQPPDQDEHVVAYAPVSVGGWRLIVEEPWVDVVDPILRFTLLAPLLVLAAAIVSLAALQFGLQRVIRPLGVLGRRASRLAWGDFQAIEQPVRGIEEIQDLQRTLQEMAAQIHRYQAGMQDYIAVLTRTQEEERKRVARELHDDTVQSLVALSQRVRMLALEWGESAAGHRLTPAMLRVQARLDEVTTMLNQTLQEVRDFIRTLRPIYLEELGLVPAVEMLIDMAAKHGLETDLELVGEDRRLSGEAELAVYRAVQEAIQNALRHSGATRVGVRLEHTGEGVTVSVEDNGRGFSAPETPGELALLGHFGLVGMYERITRLGGHLSISSISGSGTRVVAFIPAAESLEASRV